MNYDQILSSRIQQVQPSGIRKFFDILEEINPVMEQWELIRELNLLDTDAEYIFYIENGEGIVEKYNDSNGYKSYNRISVEGGTVRVSGADCPDHTCEHLGAHSWGEIICVPHDLRIEIRGKGLETDV